MGRPSKGGINVVRRTLSDGTVKEYHYAKKAPPSALGGLEFRPETTIRPDGTVVAVTRLRSRDTVDGLVDLYLDSTAYRELEPRTQFDYRRHLDKIPADLRRMTLTMLSNKREALSAFGDWREKMAKTAGRQTNLTWRIVNVMLNYAVGRGKIDFNPLFHAKIRMEKEGNRSKFVWDDEQLALMDAAACPEVRLMMWAAFWTAQRQGDLLDMKWASYDGQNLDFVQGKTRVEMHIPVAAPLKALLDATERKGPNIFTHGIGTPWDQDSFRSRWHKTCQRAGVKNSSQGGVTFHDLRGTAITRMFLAGCSQIEVSNVSGHGMKSLDAKSSLGNYIARDTTFAASAIAKFEAYEKGQKSFSKRGQTIDFLAKKAARFEEKMK